MTTQPSSHPSSPSSQDGERSLAAIPHIAGSSTSLRSNDPAVRGALFQAWLAELGRLPGNVTKAGTRTLKKFHNHFNAQYAWETPQGMVNFMDDFLFFIEHPEQRSGIGNRSVVKALDLLVRGSWVAQFKTTIEEDQAWKERAQEEPRIRLYQNPTNNRTTVHRAFLDTSWVGKVRPNGWSYAGSVLNCVANEHSPVKAIWAEEIHVLTLMMTGDAACPKLPHDGMLLNVMLGMLPAYGSPPGGVYGDPPKRPGEGVPVWGNSLVDGWTQNLLSEGVMLNDALPHQQKRMVYLSQQRLAVANILEKTVLLGTLKSLDDNDRSAPTTNVARRRL